MALSSTGNAEFSRSTTRTDNGPDLSDAQARLDAGDPTFDPLGDLGDSISWLATEAGRIAIR